MNRFLRFSINLFLCLCIASFGEFSVRADGVSEHLDLYSNVNKTAHDNIDDNVDEHAHSHKHSEDGEEHEHNHDHGSLSLLEIKILRADLNLKFSVAAFEYINRPTVKNLHSNPHLLEIFRPPIS
ncbi:MAG: hypothetical protein KC493_17755 [Bacteriovoracaceae bacterium]|nr:hypothetical protein [Bacteriovoracaceae bacterium]